MHDLATIQRMNSAIENMKQRQWAKALNSGGKGHAKDAEKGRGQEKPFRRFLAKPPYPQREFMGNE